MNQNKIVLRTVKYSWQNVDVNVRFHLNNASNKEKVKSNAIHILEQNKFIQIIVNVVIAELIFYSSFDEMIIIIIFFWFFQLLYTFEDKSILMVFSAIIYTMYITTW